MQSRFFKPFILLAAAAVLCVAPGCLPEDTLLMLKFSPDGQKLAAVSEKNGLLAIDPVAMESTVISDYIIDPATVSWTSDSRAIAYAAAADGSFDIYISSLDNHTTRVTSSPSRESYPVICQDNLLFLTRDSGNVEFSSHPLSAAAPPITLPTFQGDIIHPAISPDGKNIAFFGFENLRPQLFNTSLSTGRVERLTSESAPFSLMIDALAWSPDSGRVAYLRDPVLPGSSLESEQLEDQAASRHNRAGENLVTRDIKRNSAEQNVAHQADGLREPSFGNDGTLLYVHRHKILGVMPDGNAVAQDVDLPAEDPVSGGIADNIAYIAANQLVGLTSTTLANTRILTLGLEDKFLLAEEYFRTGSSGKSYTLYEELASSVKRARDPEMARFIYIANLRRLGRTEQAVNELERLVKNPHTTSSVQEKYLWRLLGYSYLLELDDLDRARTSFREYRRLTSQTIPTSQPDSAINALQILRKTSPEVARLYARAVKARLDGNFTLTDRLFGELLTTAPQTAAVRREYMNALDGFDSEVYYFSPSQRPFRPTRAQRAGYLQRFVDTVSTTTAVARSARLDLFLLRIEMGSYTNARALLSQALAAAPDDSRPDGILEIFRNYLETPEPQPWINAAMPDVFLHADIRPRLEALAPATEDRLLIGVAATKMALLQGNSDKARKEANAAAAEWTRIPPEAQTESLAELYGRLLVFRAREAELRGLYAEAAEGYDQAIHLLEDKHANNFEMQEEIRYRAALLRMFVSDYPHMPDRMQSVESLTGTELVNPTWDNKSLQAGVQEYLNLYDETTSTLKLWAAYEAGMCLAKLRHPWQARAALLAAATDSTPAFIQRKASLELAALDESLGDPWNAARRYANLAAFPGVSDNIRLWCSYQIARLHISIGYKIPAARDALGVIVSTRPNMPLAIQARELLISTQIR